jgi:hypothetical protein
MSCLVHLLDRFVGQCKYRIRQSQVQRLGGLEPRRNLPSSLVQVNFQEVVHSTLAGEADIAKHGPVVVSLRQPEMHIVGQAVELCNDQSGTCEPAELERLFELWPIGLLARLHFNEFLHEPPVAAIEIILDGLALRLDAKPRATLARSTARPGNDLTPRFPLIVEASLQMAL